VKGGFVGYAKDGFGIACHTVLRDLAKRLIARGAFVMLCHSDMPLIRELYGDRDFRISIVQAPRSINSAKAKRGNVNELIITGGY
jgi:DNA adenine methylase